MKILCVGYRDWALKIYKNIQEKVEHSFLLIESEEDFSEAKIYAFDPDLILFYGWSKIISDKIINDYLCLMLHPSDLPKFRGGSPIQNQIINGVKKTKISIFRINSEIDAGDIVAKAPLDLTGSLSNIFKRITDAGTQLTIDFLNNGIKFSPQDHSQATYFKRRSPEESEITLDELENCSSEYLFNKIRMLDDPYPNAFISGSDGKKIYIKKAELED